VIDVTILMDTKVGRPADMLEAAAAEGVEIKAGCLFPRVEGRVAHVAVRSGDVEILRRAVAAHGGTVADERECVVVPAGYEGGVAAISRKVSDAGVTVNVSYFGAEGEVILSTSDLDTARAALGLE